MFFLLMMSLNIALQTPSEKILLKGQAPETLQENIVGLSQTKELPLYSGMLFVFDHEASHSFTMKETSIPLALFFFDKEKKMIDVRVFEPYDPKLIISKKNCRYVLEANPRLLEENIFPLRNTELHF